MSPKKESSDGGAGAKTREKDARTEERKRLAIYTLVAVVLVVIAIASLLATSFAGGVGSCSSKLFIQSKYSCYLYYAMAMKNASVCNALPSTYAYSCVVTVASNYSSVGMCGAIGSSGYRDECVLDIGVSEKNVTSCGSLPEPYRSTCAYDIARDTDFASLSYCSYIGNASEETACTSEYYYKEAERTGELGECSYLPDTANTTVLDDIMSTQLNASTLDSLLGYDIYSNSSYYNETHVAEPTPYGYCYASVARLTGNESACGLLNGTDLALCEAGFVNSTAINYTDLGSSCADAPAELQSYCYAGIVDYKALDTKNATLCMTINQTDLAYSCLSDLAQKYANSSYCNYISNITVRQSCYLYLNGTT